jgi:hypothetical protein
LSGAFQPRNRFSGEVIDDRRVRPAESRPAQSWVVPPLHWRDAELFMTRTALIFCVALAAGYGCSKSPTSPSGQSGPGTTVFTVPLSASAETSAVTNGESNVTGTALITLKTMKDSYGTVTSASADFQVTGAGFMPGSQITMAHIHTGAANVAGAIVVNTGVTTTDAPVTGGTMQFQKTNVAVSPEIAQGMLLAPGSYYFNVHTAMNTSGVMRGQLDGSMATDPGPGPGYGY